MPYIKNYLRINVKRIAKSTFGAIDDPGILNYFISKVIFYYINFKGESYQSYNDVIGVLECVKLELYRRKISNYEDIKINENGDIYE